MGGTDATVFGTHDQQGGERTMTATGYTNLFMRTSGGMTKSITGQVAEADPGRRVISFIASHEMVDRDNELVKVAGIDVSPFARNPILLVGHNPRSTPVATVRNVAKIKVNGVPALVAEAYFPHRPQSDEALADVRAGLLNSVSIGFRTLEQGPPELPAQRGVTHVKTELLEISLVSIPSCRTCLVTAKTFQPKEASMSCTCKQPPSGSIPDEWAHRALRAIRGAVGEAHSRRRELDITPDDLRLMLRTHGPRIIAKATNELVADGIARAAFRLSGRVD
jgi:HK97 family phage prohead protease